MKSISNLLKTRLIQLTLLLFLCGFISEAQAHSLFISTMGSTSHAPGHANVVIGWGHSMPCDAFLDAKDIESYAVYSPSLKRMDFEFDAMANKGMYAQKASYRKSYKDASVQGGSYFGQQILFNNESPKGTYQVSLSSKPMYWGVWTDKNGKRQSNVESFNKFKDKAKKVITSQYLLYFAKSCVTLEEWTKPKELGHDLEIIPLTDLSNVKVGDEVSFRILFKGKRFSGTKFEEQLTTVSESYGEGHKYGVVAWIVGGKASLKVPTPGQWVVTAHKKVPVTKNNDFKTFFGKANEIVFVASFTFYVK